MSSTIEDDLLQQLLKKNTTESKFDIHTIS